MGNEHGMTSDHPQPSGRQKGFTLIELLVVLSILAVLIGTVALALTMFVGEGEETACLTDQRGLQSAVLAYHSQNGSWPTEDGNNPGDLFYGDPADGPLVPDWVIERPETDDKCDWQIDDQGLVVPADDATDCPCD